MEKNNVKYTRDGKKVVIIGYLNQTEKIVQEIFVTKDGDEIPQGERFVEKNLLDEPAKSWKQSSIESLEKTYDQNKKDWDTKIKKLNDEKRLVYDSMSARVKWLRKVAKEPIEKELKKVINQIADFLDDSEKWIFTSDYSDWHLVKFNEDNTNYLLERYEREYDRRSFDQMRLLSLYGKSDGSLVYRVNDYSDGSGSDKDVEFFKSKEEGLKFLQNKLEGIKDYSETHIKIAEKFDLVLDKSKLANYLNKKKEAVEKRILEVETQKEKLLIELKNI